jgi:hypothetical protein
MMNKFARIHDGCVAELLETDGDITQMFHPDLTWVEVAGDVSVGDRFVDGRFIGKVPKQKDRPLVAAEIKAERDRRIQSGGFKVGTKWFHSDTFSRTQQMGLVMLGANIPANTPWKTMDGSTVVMTQQLAQQIFAAAAASDIAIFAAAEAHRAALEASSDPGSYDTSAGWPKAFGE